MINWKKIHNNFYKKQNELFENYISLKQKTIKKIIVSEIKNKNLMFKVTSPEYKRYDEYNWEYNVFLKLNWNYDIEFENLYKIKEEMLIETLNMEKKQIQYNILNIEEVYKEKKEKHNEFEKMFSKFSNIQNKNKKSFIKKEKMLIWFENANNYLNWKKHDIKKLSSEFFEFITYNYSHPIFWEAFEIKEYLKNSINYKKKWLKHINWKQLEKKYKELEGFINDRYNWNTINDNWYLFVKFNQIDVISEKEDLLNLKKSKYSEKMKKSLDDEEKEINNAKNFFKLDDKKDLYYPNNEQNDFYYIQEGSIKKLHTALVSSLCNKYNLLDRKKEILLSDMIFELKYLNYSY